MAKLRIESITTDRLILTTDSLTKLITRSLVGSIVNFFVFTSIFVGIGYLMLKSQSYKGYLFNLICNRPEGSYVDCKLDVTDSNNVTTTNVYSRVKGAVTMISTRVHEDSPTDYLCDVNLLDRNKNKIGELGVFRHISDNACINSRSQVKIINQYILGDGAKPLSWRVDERTGNLMESFPNMVKDIIFFGCSCLFTFFILIPFITEEQWDVNDRSKQLNISKKSFLRNHKLDCSLNLIRKIEYTNSYLSVKVESSKKNSNQHYLIYPSSTEQQNQILKFLEQATGIKSEEISSD